MSASRGEGLRRTEEEIAREKAAALGRAGERLEATIEEAHRLATGLLAARDERERERLAPEYAAARRRVLEARLALVIQREAFGLRRHATVDQAFPEPPDASKLIGQDRAF